MHLALDDDSDQDDDITMEESETPWLTAANEGGPHSESFVPAEADRTSDPTFMCSYLDKQVLNSCERLSFMALKLVTESKWHFKYPWMEKALVCVGQPGTCLLQV